MNSYYQATVAFDTDAEYFELFNDVDVAIDYIGCVFLRKSGELCRALLPTRVAAG